MLQKVEESYALLCQRLASSALPDKLSGMWNGGLSFLTAHGHVIYYSLIWKSVISFLSCLSKLLVSKHHISRLLTALPALRRAVVVSSCASPSSLLTFSRLKAEWKEAWWTINSVVEPALCCFNSLVRRPAILCASSDTEASRAPGAAQPVFMSQFIQLLVFFEGTFYGLEVDRTMSTGYTCVLHNVNFFFNWTSTYLHSSQTKVRARVLEVTAGCWILSVGPISTTSRLQCGHRESVTEDLPGTTWARPCPRVSLVGLVLQFGSCTSLSVRECHFSHSPLLTIRNAFWFRIKTKCIELWV